MDEVCKLNIYRWRKIKFKEGLLWVLAVFFSLLVTQSQDYFSALYHNLYESPLGAIQVGLIYALLLTLPVVASTLFCKDLMKTQFIGVLLLIFSVYTIIRSSYPVSRPLDSAEKILLTVGALLISFAFARWLSRSAKRKLVSIFLIVALSWLISTPLIGLYQKYTTNENVIAFDIGNILPNPPRATVFLVLDELSPEVEGPIVDVLKADAHTLHQSEPLKAGENTINVIPGMFTHHRHDDVIPCSTNQLCGRSEFSFNFVSAADPKTDVVGVWHPYCNALGLRSCWRATFNQIVRPDEQVAVLTEVASKIPFIGRWLQTDRAKLELVRTIYANLRAQTERQAMAAPFWGQGGGLLYIHHLLPHPTGAGQAGSLASEYNHNVSVAAVFVKSLVRRLQTTFGNDFAVIITSDHPLRSFWCNQPAYANSHCKADVPAEGDRVPLLVLVPDRMVVRTPASMVGALAD